MKTREVLVRTEFDEGYGDDFKFPTNLDYNNPIHAIFDIGYERFIFETKDGAVSLSKNSKSRFFTKQICPNDDQITSIIVHHNDSYVVGLEFYSNDDVILEVGNFLDDLVKKEVKLKVGERLVGVRSKLWDNKSNNAVHSNLVLILGKLK